MLKLEPNIPNTHTYIYSSDYEGIVTIWDVY